MSTKFHRLLYLSIFMSLLATFPLHSARALENNSPAPAAAETPAPTPTPTPEDPEITRRKTEAATREAEAKAKKAEADAEAAEAAARKAEADAREKEITNREKELNMVKGTTTVSGDLIENDITAYQAVACACEPIKRKIGGSKDNIGALMIYSPQIADSLTEYSALITYLDRLDKRYDEVIAKAEAKLNNPAIAAVAALPISEIISLGLEVLSLFKTDVEITGEKIDVGREEFISRVVDGLGVPVYYPDKIVISRPPPNSALLDYLNKLLQKQSKAKTLLERISKQLQDQIKAIRDAFAPQIENLEKEIENLETRLENASSRQKPRLQKQLDEKKAALKTLRENMAKAVEAVTKNHNNEFGEIVKALNSLNAAAEVIITKFDPPAKPEDGKTMSPDRLLVTYLRAETTSRKIIELETANQNKPVYWLDLGVSKAGGNMLKKTSPIIDIFTGGDRVKFSGGAVVSFRVFSSEGQMLVSDMIWAYAPYRKAKYVTEFVCQGTEGRTDDNETDTRNRRRRTRSTTVGRGGVIIP